VIFLSLSLNKVVKPQRIELNKRAKVFSNDLSPVKRGYLEGEKANFSRNDIFNLVKNLKNIYKLPFSMMHTLHLIKIQPVIEHNRLLSSDFNELEKLLNRLKVDDYGVFEVSSKRLFKGCGVPYKYGIILSSKMNNNAFKEAPSIECQLEVARVYSESGNSANAVAKFLQEKSFGASPNHSMGGQLDYSMAAQWSGIGITGRHSMVITKKSGPCHRLSVVYTNIENLEDFILNDKDEKRWVKNFCRSCGNCIKQCPTKAILEEPVIIDGVNPTRIDYNKCCQGFKDYGCGICIKVCPFSFGKYEQIKKIFISNRE
jgi:ferredoxin